MTSGGYRKPSNPAAVSGPGRLSKRTDGGPSDQKRFDIPTGDEGQWGDNQEFANLQSSAAMGSSESSTSTPAGPPVTPFHAPTERPDEDVTSALSVPASDPDGVASAIRSAAAAFPSPQLNALVARLEAQGR